MYAVDFQALRSLEDQESQICNSELSAVGLWFCFYLNVTVLLIFFLGVRKYVTYS